MSAWETLKTRFGDGVSEITGEFVRMLLVKMEQVKEKDADAYRIYQETVSSLEMQLKEKIESELKEAQQNHQARRNEEMEKKYPFIPLENEVELFDPTLKPIHEEDREERVHDQAAQQLERQIEQKVAKESSYVEVGGKSLTFNSLNEGKLIFQDDQKNQYRLDPKEVPISLETRGMLDALSYMKSIGKEEILKSIRDAERIAKKENRPVAEVYTEKLHHNIMQHVMKSRFSLLAMAKDSIGKLDQMKKEIRTHEKVVNEQLGKLHRQYKEGKIGKEAFEQEHTKLIESKNQIQKNQERCQSAEDQLKEKLQRELKTMFPEMKMDHLDLKGSFEIAAAAQMGQTFKNSGEFKEFLKHEHLTDQLKNVEKGLVEIEEYLIFER